MKNLSGHLKNFASDMEEDGSSGAVFDRALDTAAAEWASHALKTYDGKLLKRALNISAAIVGFTAELYGK